MKIALLSFIHNTNYGGALQVYALEQAIEARYPEVECEYLDYQRDSLRIEIQWGFKRLRSCFHKGGSASDTSIKKLFAAGVEMIKGRMHPVKPNDSREQYEQFWHLSSYSRPLRKKQLASTAKEYDAFLVGSDQVWNPKLTQLDTTYLLDFVSEDSLKYCYASSFGLAELPEVCIKPYSRYLAKFSMLSSREKTGVELIRKMTGKQARRVLDPVFLLSKEEWLSVSKTIDQSEAQGYVLVYMIGESQNLIEAAKAYAQKQKWRLKLITNGGSEENGAIGPAEWLGYFAHSSFVYTNSFHGTAFSIIFNKEFRTEITVDEHFASMSSRVVDLLELFRLEDRLFSEHDNDLIIDYEHVNRLLKEEIDKSYEYLDDIMERLRSRQ